MNSDVFEKHNGYAPFDDLLLFPFFNSYPKANQLISVLIGKASLGEITLLTIFFPTISVYV